LIIAGVFVAFLFFHFFAKVIVFEYERGLKYVNGRCRGVIGPGASWIFRPNSSLVKVDIRPRVLTLPGQEVLSSDSVTVKVSLLAQFEVADPLIAVNKVQNYQESLYALLQVGLREIVGGALIDELLAKRNELSARLFEMSVPKAGELGLKLNSVDIKDIMFPGELKKVFAQVVQAQKEGLANLEKARGEAAALRHLANASKILEDNPTLMQLRALQSTGNTVVFTLPGDGLLGTLKKIRGTVDPA
jgi:regulator of protease activity HflC (stomatin/prohibitin superfamily)